MATLQGRAIKDTYKDLLQVSNSNSGVDGTLRTVEDGEGTSSALQVSTGAVKVNGSLDVTGTVTGVPHVDYRGNYSSSTSYVKDDVVVYNGSSYIAKGNTTGNAPTNATYWGLLASKGTDGTDGTNGTNGATGPQGPAGPAGPQGPAGADGADGIDGSNFNGGTITNTLTVSNSVPQLYLTDTDEGSAELGKSAILSCNTNAFRVALANDSVSRLTLNSFPHPSDTSDSTIYSGLEVNSAIKMGSQRTSAVKEQLLTNSLDGVLSKDDSGNLLFQKQANGTDIRFKIVGYTDDDVNSVGNNAAIQAEMDQGTTNSGTIGYRSNGRTQGWNGGSSYMSREVVGSNIVQMQSVMQYQRTLNRLALNTFYRVEDSTISNYGTGTATGLTGSSLGTCSALILQGETDVYKASVAVQSVQDGYCDLGTSSARFRDIYATNSTIQTSDRNAKQDIEELSEAEKRVAVVCKSLVKKFRFKDAVERKGEDARIHIGVIAQEIEQAFADEGLDGRKYGIVCVDTVYKKMKDGVYTGIKQQHQEFVEQVSYEDAEEEGITFEAEELYSIRYEELLAFIISAL